MRNTGTQPINVRVRRALDPAFTLSIPGLANDVFTLAAGAMVEASVAYNPTSAGQHEGYITFEPMGPLCAGGIAPIAVSGQTRAGALAISGALDFGETRCGETAPAQTVTVTSTGGSPVNWNAALGFGPGSPYTITPTSGNLGAGQTVTITVTPKPAPAQPSVLPSPLEDVLVISSPALELPRRVSLRQRVGGAVLSWVDATAVTMSVPVGESLSREFPLENSGSQPIDVSFVSSLPSLVKVSQSSGGRIPAGGRLPVRVTCAPQEGSGRVRADIRARAPGACALPDVAADPAVIWDPLSASSLFVPVDSVDLGAVTCGAGPAPGVLQVTNRSGQPMDVQVANQSPFGIELDGAAVGASFVLAAGQTRLAPGPVRPRLLDPRPQRRLRQVQIPRHLRHRSSGVHETGLGPRGVRARLEPPGQRARQPRHQHVGHQEHLEPGQAAPDRVGLHQFGHLQERTAPQVAVLERARVRDAVDAEHGGAHR